MKKLLKNIVFIIILFGFTFVCNVNAHTNVSLCASGCDYETLDDALDFGDTNGDVFIHIMDDNVYELTRDHELTGRLGYIRISNADDGRKNPTDTTINIEGNNHTIIVNQNNFILLYYGTKDLNINNLNIGGLSGEGGEGILYGFRPISSSATINISNCNFDEFANGDLGGERGTINIDNSTILNFSSAVHNVIIHNSNLNSIKNCLGNVNIYNSNLPVFNYIKADYFDIFINASNYDDYNVIDGYSNDYGFPEDQVNTFFHSKKDKIMVEENTVELNELLDDIVKGREAEGTSNDENIAKIENGKVVALKEGKTNLIVTTDSGHYIHNISLTVIKKEETNKKGIITVKEKGKVKLAEVFSVLSDYEGEIEWIISDPSIAKIENGEIVPLKSGIITITAVIDGVTYTYDLTITYNVPEKIMHTTIKVPITGKDVEVWVIISVVMSMLVIVGVANLILIKFHKPKNKKKKKLKAHKKDA